MLGEGLASGWLGPRSECVAYGRARASSPTGSRFRFVALSPRLLSIFSFFPTTDTIRHHTPWPTRPAGASSSLRRVPIDPGDLDFGRPATGRSPRRLDTHQSSWPAGAAFDATAR